eukprot:1377128-Amphidinium_carterae.1
MTPNLRTLWARGAVLRFQITLTQVSQCQLRHVGPNCMAVVLFFLLLIKVSTAVGSKTITAEHYFLEGSVAS